MASIGWEPKTDFDVYGGVESDNSFPYIEEVGGLTGTGKFSTLEGFSKQVLRQLHYGPATISVLTDTTKTSKPASFASSFKS